MKLTSLLSTATSTIAVGAAFLAVPAFAQSTGSADFDNTIIVTGTHIGEGIAGVRTPDSPKAKVEIGQEIIGAQRAGQSVNEIINLVPGVSFTNNDPWGSSGGSFTIRGFDSSRISQTFDGIPLNDSGNYAVYSNQQVDGEIIERVNVNLGSTDVDSPTAAAVGGTVNINTKVPDEQFGVMTSTSYGDVVADGSGGSDRSYQRMFAKVETGNLTSSGLRAYFTGSYARNGAAFANYGKVEKKQFNTKIYQPIGDNGDFVSIAGHYNENRNNFGGSPLRASAFTGDKSARFYDIDGGYPCTVAAATPGVADATNSCGTSFERRYNPSNTGNVRLASLFHLTDKLTLSVDAAYQYTKANGGGTTGAYEREYTANGFTGTGNYGGSFYFGRDLNGDGDLLDRVTLLQPSQTKTNRYVAITNLAYEINDTNRVRLSYSFDRAHHRQTGAAGFLKANGEPFDVFPINDPLTDDAGNVLQKRDRNSYATLHKVAAEYLGRFFDEALTVQLGVAAPFFKRDLNQNCFTTSTGGSSGAFVNCVPADQAAAYAAANPYVYNATTGRATGAALPQSRKLNYDKILPNVGATFRITPEVSIAGSYSKNLSVPSTDTLYNSFYFPANDPSSYRTPETSDSFDLSLRYSTPVVQAALTGWYSSYNNRLVTAYDIDGNATDTNLGKVKKYGIDASVSVRPIQPLSLYAFGSWIKSEIQDDVVTSSCAPASDIARAGLCYGVTNTVNGVTSTVNYLRTAGKRERAAPEWLFGGRAQLDLGDFQFGAQAKYTGSRFLNDINGEIQTVNDGRTPATVFPGAKFKSYTVVDLNLRYKLESLGLAKSEIQLNVTNLFDKYYVGSFSGGLDTLSSSTNAFVNFGSPRAISATLIMGF